MKVLYLAGCFSLLLIAGSCKRADVGVHGWQSKHIEAKLYDVPIPVNAQLIQNMNNTECVEESSIISYDVTLEYEQLTTYYQEEMERLGWWQTAAFKGTETLLNFEKPNKYCSISIRPFKKVARVIIFIGQKGYD